MMPPIECPTRTTWLGGFDGNRILSSLRGVNYDISLYVACRAQRWYLPIAKFHHTFLQISACLIFRIDFCDNLTAMDFLPYRILQILWKCSKCVLISLERVSTDQLPDKFRGPTIKPWIKTMSSVFMSFVWVRSNRFQVHVVPLLLPCRWWFYFWCQFQYHDV